MRDNRPILLVVGVMLILVGLLMSIPAAIDLAVANPDWQVFVVAGFLTSFVGGALTDEAQGRILLPIPASQSICRS